MGREHKLYDKSLWYRWEYKNFLGEVNGSVVCDECGAVTVDWTELPRNRRVWLLCPGCLDRRLHP